jgi:hypothetical protein
VRADDRGLAAPDLYPIAYHCDALFAEAIHFLFVVDQRAEASDRVAFA